MDERLLALADDSYAPTTEAAPDEGEGGTPLLRRLPILAPLRGRDFVLLWSGEAISMLGDGIYFVAIPWLVFSLSDSATAFSVVGVAWTLPTLVFLLLGGALSDRCDRRRVLIATSLVETVVTALIGALAVAGALQLWLLLVLVAVYGAAEAFFKPASEAIVPTLVAPQDLPYASAISHFARPLALQLIGPPLGGVLAGVFGPGLAILVDSVTFLVSVMTVAMIGAQETTSSRDRGSMIAETVRGIRFVRAHPWLWATLLAAAGSLLTYFGAVTVLLPLLLKDELHAGAAAYGGIRALSGVAAVLGAVAIAQIGMPRRCVTVMLAGWGLQSLLLLGYVVATDVWLFAVVALASGLMGAFGNVIWGTLLKSLVPNELLGRVASLDWLVSIAFVPASLAVIGPVADALGARRTVLAASVLGALSFLAAMAVPGVRDPEQQRPRATTPDDGGSLQESHLSVMPE